jgi:hypothetical protein
MQAYRSPWLRLGDVKAQLMASGFSAAHAEAQIADMVRNGVFRGSDGDGPRIRLNYDDNPLASFAGPRADPWGWLRGDPRLDFERSMILRPVRRSAPPPRSVTEETLRMVREAMMPGAAADQWTWEWTPIEILDELPPVAAVEPLEVAAVDPAEQTVYRTGAIGRPTSRDLVLAEFRRRYDDAERHDSIAEWSRILAAWLGTRHPEAPQLTPKTIRAHIRSLLPELWVPKNIA